MTALRKKPSQASPRVGLRYYLWADDALWRIPDRLHALVVRGEVLLPRFANTRCKIVEVFVRRELSQSNIERARGVIYSFDEKGRLDLSGIGEAVEMMVQGSRPRHLQQNVIDMGLVIRDRRWSALQIWKPTAEIVRLIAADLKGAKGIRPLKP